MRTALLGTGGIGQHLAREVTEHPDGELAALVDVDETSLEETATSFDVPEAATFTDEEAMYAEIEGLDAVIIATPPAFHYASIERAFERGLHVLCEKPVVMDTEEADDVLEWLAGNDLTLMAGYQRHLNPGFVHAYERWHDGEGPEPTFVTGELTQDWRDHFEKGENWRLDPEIGGNGHLFSVGTHVLESVLWMTGLTPESVSAEMTFYDDDEQIDTQASLSVRFENGAVGSFGDSAVTPATMEHIHAWDDDGSVYLEGENWSRRELTVRNADGEAVTPEIDYDDAPTKFAAFVEAIETGTEPPATALDARRVTALLEAAYESARTGERVEVDTR